MSADDLDTPLGYAPTQADASSISTSRDVPWGAVALAGMGVLAASLVAFTVVTDRASVQPPQVVAAIDYVPPRRISVPDLPVVSAQPSDEDTVVSVAPNIRIVSPAAEQESGVKIIRRNGADGSEAIVIRVPQQETRAGALAPAPDARLVVHGPHGPLPRIGRDGSRPADVYARPVADLRLPARAPRIALVVTGMGINSAASASAIKTLPPMVTLGFSPYGARIEDQAEQARLAGHELLLQVPMEGFVQSHELGARALMSNASRERNLDALHWHMSRFQGYIGLTNFLGARFMANASALSPLMQDIAERGLVFFDDGSSRQALTSAIALATGAPTLRADLTIDAGPNVEAIDASLRKLELLARDKGMAIGVASALPANIDRITRFAQGLEARGIALVPLSALMPAPARTVAR